MTRVVFVGEMYNADLSVGGGPIIPAPQPPLGIWGGYRPPYVDAGLPGPQPGGPVDPGWSGGTAPPPGIWGGYRPPYVDAGLPGQQPGSPPLGMWGGGNVPMPSPPIYIPGQSPITDPGDPQKAHLVAYVPHPGGGYTRTTFTVDMPAPGEPPTEATPKV